MGTTRQVFAIVILAGAVLAGGAAAGGCTFGSGEEEDTPYDTASLAAPEAAVADGRTPALVTITGEPGATVVVTVTGTGMAFLDADTGSAGQKTVFLVDGGDGVGTGTAGVVASAAGRATVALLGDPLRTARTIEFRRVRLAVGAPVAVAFDPGVIEYRLCVAVESDGGAVVPTRLVGEPGFDRIRAVAEGAVSATPPAELGCPAAADGYQGWATLVWWSRTGRAELTLGFDPGVAAQTDLPATDDDETDTAGTPTATLLGEDTVDLRAHRFPGYQLTVSPPDFTEAWVYVEIDARYVAVDEVAAEPAEGVTLANLRFIPEGPTILATSSGDADDPVVTGADGKAYLFIERSSVEAEDYAVFVTPTGGPTVFLFTLTGGG